jgi:hypothetical protein
LAGSYNYPHNLLEIRSFTSIETILRWWLGKVKPSATSKVALGVDVFFFLITDLSLIEDTTQSIS